MANSPTKQASRTDRRRDEILDAATALFAELGYTDCLTQRLAERLGVGKGTIYRHFPSKRELFLAAADRVIIRLREWIEAEIEPIHDPLDQWCQAVRSFMSFFADHPEYVELLVQERAQFKDRQRPSCYVQKERYASRWRDVFQALIEKGRLRGIPAERISDVVGDLLYGTIFLNYFAVRESRPEVQAENILDVVLRGILSEEERQAWGS